MTEKLMYYSQEKFSTFYATAGEVGPHLTLIHEVGSDLKSWDKVVDTLAPQYRLLRYDLRGHGRSGKPSGPYNLSQFVDDLAGLLDHCAVSTTTVVGFSFGGLIGQAFALAYPKRVQDLVLVSTVCGRTPEERARVLARADALTRDGEVQTIGEVLKWWFTPEFGDVHPKVVEAPKYHAPLEHGPLAYAAAYRVFAQEELADEIHRISHPTLVMTGEHDSGSTVRMAALMHERMVDARMDVLPNLHHSVLLEAPELVASKIADFMQRIPA